jgi:hypothetical protein
MSGLHLLVACSDSARRSALVETLAQCSSEPVSRIVMRAYLKADLAKFSVWCNPLDRRCR